METLSKQSSTVRNQKGKFQKQACRLPIAKFDHRLHSSRTNFASIEFPSGTNFVFTKEHYMKAIGILARKLIHVNSCRSLDLHCAMKCLQMTSSSESRRAEDGKQFYNAARVHLKLNWKTFKHPQTETRPLSIARQTLSFRTSEASSSRRIYDTKLPDHNLNDELFQFSKCVRRKVPAWAL